MSLPCTSASCSRTTPSSNTSPAEAAKKSRKFEEWKSTQQKAKSNRGESYVSKTGKQVSEFIMSMCIP